MTKLELIYHCFPLLFARHAEDCPAGENWMWEEQPGQHHLGEGRLRSQELHQLSGHSLPVRDPTSPRQEPHCGRHARLLSLWTV